MSPELTNEVLVLEDNPNARIENAERPAQQAERLAGIGQMAAVLAHEGRDVVQLTLCNLEILASKLTNRPELLDLVGRARNAQRGLARLFEDLHSYAASLTLQREVLHPSDIWREAWSDLSDLRQEKVGELRENIQGHVLSGDRFRLKQVFRNLFENALAASPAPARIEVHSTEAILSDGRAGIRVIVRDNGPGLSQEERQRAFELFYTTKSKGTGLGLAITKRIVEAHGGQISVGNGGSTGAEFVIVLPHEKEMCSAVESAPPSAGEIRSRYPALTAHGTKDRSRKHHEEATEGSGRSGAAGGHRIP
jgi:signal transduction histidine kinase